RGAGVEGARAARGDERHPGPDGRKLVVPEDPRPGTCPPVADQADRRGVLDHADARVTVHLPDERLGDGRAGDNASNMKDSPATMSALAAEPGPPVGAAIQLDAQPLQVADAVDALGHENRR